MKSIDKPIIIFGTGRSGTSVFMGAFFRHRELAFFSNYLARKPNYLWLNYFRYIFDNKFYRILGNNIQKENPNIFYRIIFKPSEAWTIWKYLVGDEVNFPRDFLLNKKLPSSSVQRLRKYIEKITKIQGKNRFALKITGPGRLYFLKNLFPDAKFIYIRRKFIPTLASFLKVSFWQNRKIGELW